MPPPIMRLPALALLLVPLAAFAQMGVVAGRVLEAGAEGLPFAHVRLEGTGLGTVADAEGCFLLEGVPAGEGTLLATAVGYTGQRRAVVFAGGDTTTVHLELTPGRALEEVVVSGTMRQSYLLESPVKVEVVSAEQVNTYLPSAASGLVESVRLVNGVQEVVACGVCFTNSLSINGLPGPYTTVLMDGMPIYGSLASVYGLNGIPNMIVDRFEVTKGPNSTLYGSEAVAGVINIVTRDPAEQHPFELDLMGTTHREGFGNLGLAPRIGNSSGFVGVNWAYLNDFSDDNGDGFGDMADMDRVSLFTKWAFGRPSGKAWTLAAKGYYEDRRNGLEGYLRNRAYRTLRGNDTLYGESIYTRRVELFGSYTFHTRLPLRLDHSATWHDQDSYYGADHYVGRQGTGFLNLLHDAAYGEHRLLAGATLRGQIHDDNTAVSETVLPAGDTLNQPDRQVIPGVFVQDEWRINDRLTVLGGLRLDHYRRHGFVWSPRLSVKAKPGRWTTLRLNAGSGFRIVNLFAEDHAFVTGQREVVLQEGLRPERSWSGSLNAHHVFNLGLGTGSLDLDAFGTWFTDKVITDYGTVGEINYRNVAGYALTAGTAVGLRYQFAFPLGIEAGAQAQRAVEVEDEGPARDIELAPRWTAVFTANYTWRAADLTVGLTANATGPMALPEVYDLGPDGQPVADPRPLRSEPFVLANLQVEKRFGEAWAVYGGVQNLLDYRQPGSPLSGLGDPANPPGFSPFFDTAYAWAPNHGREAYLGLRWRVAR